ncbi:MAG: hypothetical protein EB053_05180 [Chlamydiae bacterium]|nr:hypothetical protein [Chlamydiota bacterium]
MVNLIKFLFIPLLFLPLCAEDLKDVEEMIESVLQDLPKYSKRLLELGATNTNYEVQKEGKRFFFRLSANLVKELYSSQDIEYMVLKQLEALMKKASTQMPRDLEGLTQTTLEKIQKKLSIFPKKTLCHLDLHHKNILKKGDRLFLIDWEYAAMSF